MPVSRLAVKSCYDNIHGGYEVKGSHDGFPAFRSTTGRAWIFHESKFGGKFWYIGSSLPSGRNLSSYARSTNDAASPEQASWPSEILDNVKDASKLRDFRREAADLFHDPEFPHNDDSIGPIVSKGGGFSDCTWTPARFLWQGRWRLFDGVEPSDLLQGSLGNCWFVAALACMAEFPQEVIKLFVDVRDLNAEGKYTIRLFDHTRDSFRNLVVDEFIPCHHRSWWDECGKPLFAKPNGNEVWVLLLEKAMAKMFGNYSKLDGNHAGIAFRAFTGEPNTFMWKKERNRTWTNWTLKKRSTAFTCKGRPQSKSADDLLEALSQYDRSNFMMSASMDVRTGMEHKRKDGLVEGHAYSLLQVVRSQGQSLICLRNPWGGDRQWTGAWSDGDTMWTRFPALKEKLRPTEQADGLFWMSWADFVARWDSVVVCGKSMRSGDAAAAHSHAVDAGLADLSLSFMGSRLARPPPVGSMMLPTKPSGVLNCPGKHGLSKQKGAFTCDLCKRSAARPGLSLVGCRQCDYDVCSRCLEKAEGYTKATDGDGGTGPSAAPAKPADADAEPVKPIVGCRGHHELVLARVTHKGYTCDLGKHMVKTGSRMWGCRICDFDICMECAAGSGHGKRPSAAGHEHRKSTHAKTCKNGCGREAFQGYETCCTHCKGADGPHARDCEARATAKAQDVPAHVYPVGSNVEYFSASSGNKWIPAEVRGFKEGYYQLDVNPRADPSKVRLPTRRCTVTERGEQDCEGLPVRDAEELDDMKHKVLMFDSIRKLPDIFSAMTPCEHGCGRPAFGHYKTCCTHCQGTDGPHARDCDVKAGVDATAS